MSGILLATHGGETADGAVRVVSDLARRMHVPLHVLAILQPIAMLADPFGAAYLPTAEDLEESRTALLEAVTEQLGRCGVRDCPLELRAGLTTSEIASAARALAADLIVVGLGSHQIIDRALGDETALYLAQVAATPVLALPATATAAPKKIVAAIDFSPTSVLAARTAARWMERGDGMRLVHVASDRSSRGGRSTPAERDEPAPARLEELASQLRGATPGSIDTRVVVGDPARALLDHAREIDADLIALGSHGYGIWKRLVLGSVASKVIRLSPRAVLVAPIGSLATIAAAEIGQQSGAVAGAG